MNLLDLFIILFLLAALIRGTEVGFIRQFCSTVGFFVGLFFGAWLQNLFIGLAGTPNARALMAIFFTLGFAIAFMVAGEYAGLVLKFRLRHARLTNRLDKIFGAALAAATLLLAVWLSTAIFRNIPDGGWQRQIRNSAIVNMLDNALPSAPNVLTRLGHLIDPNGFPEVFSGVEPKINADLPLPDLGELNAAVQKVRASVVRIEGEGCNSVVFGSGFVAASNQIITNAHVVAGVKDPYVIDQKGRHHAKVVLFDPDLDIAVLHANNLAGTPLLLTSQNAPNGTDVAILGYPAGGQLTVDPGITLDVFVAKGRNIYNMGSTVREVYSIKADVHQGNSGGPMVDKNGTVIGVIFAKSINYDHVTYALTPAQILADLQKAKDKTESVAANSCTQ